VTLDHLSIRQFAPPLRRNRFFFDLVLYEILPVFKASYDLLLNIYQFTGNFTREYKYTLSEKIKSEILVLKPTLRSQAHCQAGVLLR